MTDTEPVDLNERLQKVADQMSNNREQLDDNLKRLEKLKEKDGENTRENWIFAAIGCAVGVLVGMLIGSKN